jgi:hypothetical protein
MAKPKQEIVKAIVVVGMFLLGLVSGALITYRLQQAKTPVLNGQVEQPDPEYSVQWNPRTTVIKVKHNPDQIAEFKLPNRPLAIWLKPLTSTMVIAASEDGSIASNQILYLYRNNRLSTLYHATSGYEGDRMFNRRFYKPEDKTSNLLDDIYITPNEELIFAREYQDYGFYPRVFHPDQNKLTSYRNNTDHKNMYWSPNGRCYLYWSKNDFNNMEWGDEFGFFFKPNDFVSYQVYDNTNNRREIDIRWEKENPCTGYISMVADEVGGEGAPSFTNKEYIYRFGENVPDHLEEIDALPKGSENFSPSTQPELKLIFATRGQ